MANTRRRIELAIKRIQIGRPRIVRKDRKLSVLAVAEEAAVTDGLIHNTYPDLARRIRSMGDHSWRERFNTAKAKLNNARQELRLTKAELQQLRTEYERIADHNKLLSMENQELRATSKSKVVSIRAARV